MAGKDSRRIVGDYVSLQRGNTYSGKLVGKPGPALLGLGSIEPGGGFRQDNYKSFGGDCPPKIMLHSGGLYVALKGATKDGSMVGSVARLPTSIASGRLTQDTARLDFFDRSPEIANHLYWVLRTPQYRQYCAGRLTGSAAASFSREDFLSYPVPPITSATTALVNLLEALDTKVETNRRMNGTLEMLLRASFNWSMEQTPPTGRTSVRQLATEGVLVVNDGYRAKNDELGPPGLPFIRAGELDNGFDTDAADVLNERSISRVGNKVSRPGDVAFTSKGTIGRFARVAPTTPTFVYSPQVCFWRSLNEEKLHPALLYAWMTSDDLGRQIDAVAGQTDMAPYVSLRDQRSMTMPVFGPEYRHVAETLQHLLNRQSLNLSETRTLVGVRDVLLPGLITGAIRLREAEKALGASL